jgi:anti-sigma factor RsiW
MAESVPTRVTCEQATALLIDYITGELDPATTLVLEQHLERCVDCVFFLRTYKETIRTTRTLRYDDMPGELQDRVLQTLHAKMQRARPQ